MGVEIDRQIAEVCEIRNKGFFDCVREVRGVRVFLSSGLSILYFGLISLPKVCVLMAIFRFVEKLPSRDVNKVFATFRQCYTFKNGPAGYIGTKV